MSFEMDMRADDQITWHLSVINHGKPDWVLVIVRDVIIALGAALAGKHTPTGACTSTSHVQLALNLCM